MPRVRRRQNYRQLSEFERGRIIGLHETGIGFGELARTEERNIATIFDVEEAGQLGRIEEGALDDLE